MTDDSPANNNAAIFGKHVRELETRHETLIEKLLNATEEMCGAFSPLPGKMAQTLENCAGTFGLFEHLNL